MAGNIAGIGGYYNPYGIYSSMDYDFDEYDSYSMNGSLFNMTPYASSPYAGAYNSRGYMDYSNIYDYQVQMQESQRYADLRLNAPMEGVQKAAAILNEKITSNDDEQIGLALEKYINSVRNLYPNGKEEDIVNRAGALYQQIYGTSLINSIKENGDSSFKYGLLKGLTFGLYDGSSAERNISQITGLPVSRKEKAKEIAGKILGFCAPVIAIAAIFSGSARKLLGKISSAKKSTP